MDTIEILIRDDEFTAHQYKPIDGVRKRFSLQSLKETMEDIEKREEVKSNGK